jgi:small subunit ribosomal protein S1
MKQVEPDPWEVIEQRFQPGMRVQGKVRNLTDFGAFVELEPGIDGLLHISDMTWARNVSHPSEVLKKSQAIETVILHVDKEAKRISLGLKQIQPDPWDSVLQKYPVGSNVKGKVVRLADFGAFVELEPGVDGLLHVSQMSHRPVARPEDIVQLGDELTLKVIRVDPNERRIGLSLRDLAADLIVAEEQDQLGRRGGRRRERDRYGDDDDE